MIQNSHLASATDKPLICSEANLRLLGGQASWKPSKKTEIPVVSPESMMERRPVRNGSDTINLLSREASVDHQLGPGHVRGFVGGQIQHAVGNVFRLRDAAQGNLVLTCCASAGSTVRNIAVSAGPGITVFTRIPSRAY